MTAGRVPPHNLDAERAFLGAALLTPVALPEVVPLVLPEDFYLKQHAASWAAMRALFGDGSPVDVTTVAEAVSRTSETSGPAVTDYLVKLMHDTPAVRNIRDYCSIIVAHAAARRTITVASTMIEQAYSMDEAGGIADQAIADLRLLLDESAVDKPSGLERLADFVGNDRALSPWVVRGLLRRQWRAVVIAEEGAGKTVLMRQVAVCAAAGVQPFTGHKMDPVRALIVDLENPDDQVIDVCRPLIQQANVANPTWDRGRLHIWHKPSGVNLRKRAHRAQFVNVLQSTRPDLVVIGPLYKMSTRGESSYEQDAGELQEFLDDVRIRFGFALMIEHHMPQARDSKSPKGSALWRHWPDLGLLLEQRKGSPTAFTLGSWRGKRVRASWPRELFRENAMLSAVAHSGGWPWRTARPTDDLPTDDDLAPPADPPLPYKDD